MKKGLSDNVRRKIAIIEHNEGASIVDIFERLYTIEGLSCNQIRHRWQLHHRQFNDLIIEFGLEQSNESAVVRRIERLEGSEIAKVLHDLYINQGLSYRQLNARWGTQPSTLIGLMKKYKVEPRKGGEAVAMQWVGNTARRVAAAKSMSVMSKAVAAAGRHSRLGKPNPDKNWCRTGHTPEARRKGSTTRQKLFASNPFMHPNAKVDPTAQEAKMLDHLRSKGYLVDFNFNCQPHWIDVYLPELGVGIECVNNKRPTWERHLSIVQQGIHMLYVGNNFIEDADFRQLDAYLLAYQSFQHNSEFRVQDAVVWGSQRVFYFPDQPASTMIEIMKSEDLYCLRYSAAK